MTLDTNSGNYYQWEKKNQWDVADELSRMVMVGTLTNKDAFSANGLADKLWEYTWTPSEYSYAAALVERGWQIEAGEFNPMIPDVEALRSLLKSGVMDNRDTTDATGLLTGKHGWDERHRLTDKQFKLVKLLVNKYA